MSKSVSLVKGEEKVIKAGLYLRFSSDAQKGGVSIEVQEDGCRRYCETKGYAIGPIDRNEAVSAKETNTKRIQDLVAFCKSNKDEIDVLIVYKLSRFARDTTQHYWLKGEMVKLGIRLESATEPIDDEIMGPLIEAIFSGWAEVDNKMKRNWVIESMWKRVDQGLYPWRPPSGYKPDIKPEGVKLMPHVVDLTCAHVIQYIFKQFSLGVTKAALHRELSKKTIRDYSGRKLQFHEQSIHKILNNWYYCQLLRNREGVLIDGLHEPLISKAIFTKCQQLQQRRHPSQMRIHDHPDFPLRYFIRCGSCSAFLKGAYAKSGKYAYYYCRTKTCEEFSKMIPKAELENDFSEYIRQVKPTPINVEKFKTTFISVYKERETEIKNQFSAQVSEVTKLEADQQQLLEIAKKGLLPDELIKTNSVALENKIKLAKAELGSTITSEFEIGALLEFAYSFIETVELAWAQAPFDLKVRLQKMVFPDGVTYLKKGCLANSRISSLFNLNTLKLDQPPTFGGPTFGYSELLYLKEELSLWHALSKDFHQFQQS